MLKGNNAQDIFQSEGDRIRFCQLMQEGVERFGHKILAFCLMSNHVHIVIQTNQKSISLVVQNIAFRYTRFWNWRHDAAGHLFQGRFKSILVGTGSYLNRLIRYIHLNPVRAGLVQKPIDYRWSSHTAYMFDGIDEWVDSDVVLRRFGVSHQRARQSFNSFVLEKLGKEDDIDFDCEVSDEIIDSEASIETVMDCIIKTKKPDGLRGGLDDLLRIVTAKYEIDIDTLKSSRASRRITHVRSVLAHLVREWDDIALQELAEVLGRDASAMSKAATRFESRMRNSVSLTEEVEELKLSLTKKKVGSGLTK